MNSHFFQAQNVYQSMAIGALQQTPPGRVGYSAAALPHLSIWLYGNEMRGREGERGREEEVLWFGYTHKPKMLVTFLLLKWV